MKKPKFSIIIPTLNEEKFLPKLLTSLTKQTIKDFEVIVVDGQSQDKTIVCANRFKTKLPSLTVVSCSRGVSKQRNMGGRIGHADWLVLVDADSILLPRFIERISWFIDHKHPKVFTTWLMADRDDPSYAIAGFLFNMTTEGGILVEHPWAPGPLTIVRRDVFEMVGGYNENVTYGEDHELGVTIQKRGIPFSMLREVLYIYSFRRFRKEGTLKVLNRTLKSNLSIFFTDRGLAHMPGFVSGGSIYGNKEFQEKKKKNNFFKDAERILTKIINDFLSV
jgi:glycosyltransferase involved in cell wall biosynthesis